MKKVLVFAGTTEGRELAELLADSNIKCSVCVATDYALELMDDKRLDVHCGRLTEEEMEVLMRDGSFDVVVDATHPYAQIVSQNVRQAADKESIPFIRLRRSTESAEEGFISLRHMKNAARGCRFRQEIFYLLQEVRIWAAMQKMKQLRIAFLCVCFREKKAFVYVRQMALLGVRSLQCRDRFLRR